MIQFSSFVCQDLRARLAEDEEDINQLRAEIEEKEAEIAEREQEWSNVRANKVKSRLFIGRK